MNLTEKDLKNLFKLFSYEEHDLDKTFFNKEVDPALATRCIDAWKDFFRKTPTTNPTGFNATAIKGSYTESITFASPDLIEWLSRVGDPAVTNANNIKICLGAYTQEMIDTYSIEQKMLGRLTAFLWPYKDKAPATFVNKEHINPGPVPPYNIGSLYP